MKEQRNQQTTKVVPLTGGLFRISSDRTTAVHRVERVEKYLKSERYEPSSVRCHTPHIDLTSRILSHPFNLRGIQVPLEMEQELLEEIRKFSLSNVIANITHIEPNRDHSEHGIESYETGKFFVGYSRDKEINPVTIRVEIPSPYSVLAFHMGDFGPDNNLKYGIYKQNVLREAGRTNRLIVGVERPLDKELAKHLQQIARST